MCKLTEKHLFTSINWCMGGGLLIEEAVKPIKIQLKVQCQFYSLLHILQSGPVSQIQVSDGLVLAPGP